MGELGSTEFDVFQGHSVVETSGKWLLEHGSMDAPDGFAEFISFTNHGNSIEMSGALHTKSLLQCCHDTLECGEPF